MSLPSRLAKARASHGMPSMTYNGSLPDVADWMPRMRTETLPSGWPPNWSTCTPGILAAMASRKSAVGMSAKSSALIDEKAVVTSRLFCTP